MPYVPEKDDVQTETRRRETEEWRKKHEETQAQRREDIQTKVQREETEKWQRMCQTHLGTTPRVDYPGTRKRDLPNPPLRKFSEVFSAEEAVALVKYLTASGTHEVMHRVHRGSVTAERTLCKALRELDKRFPDDEIIALARHFRGADYLADDKPEEPLAGVADLVRQYTFRAEDAPPEDPCNDIVSRYDRAIQAAADEPSASTPVETTNLSKAYDLNRHDEAVASVIEKQMADALAYEYASAFGEDPKALAARGKLRMSVVPIEVMKDLALAMGEGADKYGVLNFRHSTDIRASTYYDATMRHLLAYWQGEDIDPDSPTNRCHLVKAMASLCVLVDAALRNENFTDDRPRPHV